MSTKTEIINLYQSLNKLGNLTGVKFAYAISRNISLIEPEIKSIEKSLEQTEDFKSFEVKRIELVKKFAKKDEKGESVIINNQYELENEEEFNKEFELLKEENKEVWGARQKQVDEYNELLKSESTVTLHKINLVDVPQNISVAQLHSISLLLNEEGVPSPFQGK
jgi:pyruvate/2-oxoacid:ferredoxin oxidoreductase beta subunit